MSRKRVRVRLIRQSEASECGLACLAMVAKHYGLDVDLAGLRQAFPTSSRGVTLQSLLAVAREIGLDARAVRLDLPAISALQMPAILHWDFAHFVVARGVSGRVLDLCDPGIGELRLDVGEVSLHFTGIAVVVRGLIGAPRRFRADTPSLNLTAQVPSFWSRSALLLGAMLLLQSMALIAPWYLQIAVDYYLQSFEVATLWTLAGVFAAVLATQAALGIARAELARNLGEMVTRAFSMALFDRLLRVPMRFLLARSAADVSARFRSIDPIRTVLSEDLAAIALDSILVLLAIALLIAYAPIVAMAPVSTLALLAFARACSQRHLRQQTDLMVLAQAREATMLADTVRSVSTIRAFGKADARLRQWRMALDEVADAEDTLARSRSAKEAIQAVLIGVSHIVTVTLLISHVVAGAISLGALFAFVLYSRLLLERGAALIDRVASARLIGVHVDRLSDVLTTPEEPGERGGAEHPLESFALSLKDVAFSYEPNLHIIEGLTAHVSEGECVVILGPSGAGKSTLLRLMTGLLRPSEGMVCFGGADAVATGWSRIRNNIGLVLQDDSLVSGSIADNIAFLDPEPDMERVVEAAASAALLDDIGRMPMGFETLVSSGQNGLSAGQTQRILLARALYRRPRVLFLDEATSNVDVETESKILMAMRSLAGLTRVIVTHREVLAEVADQVWTLNEGRISVARPTLPRACA